MAVSDIKALFSQGAFEINALMTRGLSLFVNGGRYIHASLGLQAAPNITITLAASSTTYVEMDDNGVISANTTGFTSGSTSLYVVTTGTAEITDIADVRGLGGLSGRVDGAQLPNTASGNVVGVPGVIHRIDVAAGANADIDTVITHKTRVIDSFLILRQAGVGSATFQVKNGASAITNAMAASGSDQALVRAASIDDSAWEIAAGGTLRVTGASGASMPAATVYVIGHRVP